MDRRIVSLMVLGLAASTTSKASAGLTNFGTANNYNVFVIQNDSQSNTDAQGRVAVGGYANFSNGYNVGSSLSAGTPGSAPNLVVGGNLSESNNSITGNVVVGGNATIANPTINGSLAANGSVTLTSGTVNGNVTYGTTYSSTATVGGTHAQGSTTVPVNFSAEQANLINLSNSLANASNAYTYGNGVTFQYGGFTLTGTNSKIDVFNINGSDLATANGLTVNAPFGATVVINVNGTSDSMQNFGITINGTDKQHVVFNFSRATSLYFTGIGIEGSVLAPQANINFAGGDIDGTMIGDSITGQGESHNFQFQGDFSPLVSVPEPASVASTAVGLALAGFVGWRRRRAS